MAHTEMLHSHTKWDHIAPAQVHAAERIAGQKHLLRHAKSHNFSDNAHQQADKDIDRQARASSGLAVCTEPSCREGQTAKNPGSLSSLTVMRKLLRPSVRNCVN